MLHCGMFGILFNAMNLMVSVPFVSLTPWANHPSSMYITFIQSLHKSGLSISFLFFVTVSLMTRWTTLVHDSLIYIGRENKNLEFCSAVGIACGTLAENTMPSTEYTASCKIVDVLRGDCTLTGRCF